MLWLSLQKQLKENFAIHEASPQSAGNRGEALSGATFATSLFRRVRNLFPI